MRRSSADAARARPAFALGMRTRRLLASVRDRLADDTGSAAIEFLGAGVLLLVPIAYGAVTVAQIEQAVYASELGARNAARVLVGDRPFAEAFAERHLEYALADAGFSPEHATITVSCAPNPDCATPGGTLTVTVRIDVPVPLLPGASEWLTIPVESSATFPRTDRGR